MKMEWVVESLVLDALEREFVRSTVLFAVWHHEGGIDQVEIHLDRRRDAEGREEIGCVLFADGPLGTLFGAAWAPDVQEATRLAADRLEVAVVGAVLDTPILEQRAA